MVLIRKFRFIIGIFRVCVVWIVVLWRVGWRVLVMFSRMLLVCRLVVCCMVRCLLLGNMLL